MADRIKGASGGAPSPELTQRFTAVFNDNLWVDPESVSGWGSRRDSHSVKLALEALTHVFNGYGIDSVIDVPCGDFNWMPMFLEGRSVTYRGLDIVPPLIEKNRTNYPNYAFEVLDITQQIPVPGADLVFCKDLLNHLTYSDVSQALNNIIASGSRYMLLSNNFGHENQELPGDVGGNSRHLDILKGPFYFSQPIWNTDYLGLWDLTSRK